MGYNGFYFIELSGGPKYSVCIKWLGGCLENVKCTMIVCLLIISYYQLKWNCHLVKHTVYKFIWPTCFELLRFLTFNAGDGNYCKMNICLDSILLFILPYF